MSPFRLDQLTRVYLRLAMLSWALIAGWHRLRVVALRQKARHRKAPAVQEGACLQSPCGLYYMHPV